MGVGLGFRQRPGQPGINVSSPYLLRSAARPSAPLHRAAGRCDARSTITNAPPWPATKRRSGTLIAGGLTVLPNPGPDGGATLARDSLEQLLRRRHHAHRPG